MTKPEVRVANQRFTSRWDFGILSGFGFWAWDFQVVFFPLAFKGKSVFHLDRLKRAAARPAGRTN